MSARFGVLILATPLMICLSASAQDHLEPERGILSQMKMELDYAKRIREVLLKDAAGFHVARVVCLPAFELPWAVTLVRDEWEDFDEPPTYYVECTVAEKRLYPAHLSEGVKAKKSRATIDHETAYALNKTWRQILHTTRYPKIARWGTDGTTYHFSRCIPVNEGGDSPFLFGGAEQGQIWSPDKESRCARFVELGELLKEFAQAKPKERGKNRASLRAKIDELRAELDRAERDQEADRVRK